MVKRIMNFNKVLKPRYKLTLTLFILTEYGDQIKFTKGSDKRKEAEEGLAIEASYICLVLILPDSIIYLYVISNTRIKNLNKCSIFTLSQNTKYYVFLNLLFL